VVYGRRNDVLFTVFNVPFLFLPVHLLATTFNGLRAGLRGGHVLWAIEGLAKGYATALLNLRSRQPVKQQTYRDFRFLKRREIRPSLLWQASAHSEIGALPRFDTREHNEFTLQTSCCNP